MTHHRVTLKQQNKSHKTGQHRSNRSVSSAKAGRVQVQTGVRRPPVVLGRRARRQQLRQLRTNKHQRLLQQLYPPIHAAAGAGDADDVAVGSDDVTTADSMGSTDRCLPLQPPPPLLVAVVAVSRTLNAQCVRQMLVDGAVGDGGELPGDSVVTPQNITHIRLNRSKRTFAIMAPSGGDLHAVLDATRCADVVVFALNEEGVDSEGGTLLSAVFAQGVSSSCTVLVTSQDNEKNTNGRKLLSKKQGGYRKKLVRQLNRWFPQLLVGSAGCSRLHVLHTPAADVPPLLHRLANVRHRTLPVYRQRRSHILAECVEFSADPDPSVGTLRVTGYIRHGVGISANQLVHVCGWGDFQLSHISSPISPIGGASSVDDVVLSSAHAELQVALDCENTAVDESSAADGSAVGDYGEDMMTDADTYNRLTRRVLAPRGASQYQAMWIAEAEDDGSEMADLDNADHCNDMETAPCRTADTDSDITAPSDEEDDDDGDDDDDDEMSACVDDNTVYDNAVDLEEENDTLAKIKAAREDELFPDEVDTPHDVAARHRFAKYRGLASFRTACWNPRENLPSDYARCYQLANMKRAQRLALNHRWSDAVQPGRYVTLHIIGVPTHLYTEYISTSNASAAVEEGACRPLLVFALLRHEHRMSVVHTVVRRHRTASHLPPIAAKSRLVFHVGFRRYVNTPIFSQHSNMNKHKMERYFRSDTTLVATMYAPITYGPVPVLVMIEKSHGQQELLATGSLLSSNPDRIVVKRAVLSGHPFKVNKHSAVIRYMFFNREDILWFKPVELRTKMGRRGNIKEPLGTHGHMKAVFNGQLASQDTVLMTLYKRVFPRWGYNPIVPLPAPIYTSETTKSGSHLPSIAEQDEEFFDCE